MAAIRDLPLFTAEYDRASDFQLPENASYIYAVTSEPRSGFAAELQVNTPSARFVRITQDDTAAHFETDLPGHERLPVRRRSAIERFLGDLGTGAVYLDITGLGHQVWAPLVRVCLETGIRLNVVYLEPETYSSTAHAELGTIFDLSERTDGIRPLPLFATLSDERPESSCFVPLLGFEGARFLQMLNEVEPAKGKVFPIVGVPGFRPHYPLDALIGNAVGLEQDKAVRNLRFARSNCPFSLYHEVQDIADRAPNDQVRLGLIGTKPHALGAILFAIANDDRTEIIYDNARRKVGRTSGTAKCLVYAVSDFLPPSRWSPRRPIA
ncbi:hypothetical protein [Sphingobium yanoikuyae]|uniref:hypothetical protein n=1 Tax=Sphingobium yanoikuyae TaxID=13690 RepID=UPI0028AE8CC7|nr:hypothetical protein [Sphingobium yanoikuyae]